MSGHHFDPEALRSRVARERFGYLTGADIALLAAHQDARLWQVLIRCGRCRLVVATQDVAFVIGAIEGAGDYVRDISFLAGVTR